MSDNAAFCALLREPKPARPCCIHWCFTLVERHIRECNPVLFHRRSELQHDRAGRQPDQQRLAIRGFLGRLFGHAHCTQLFHYRQSCLCPAGHTCGISRGLLHHDHELRRFRQRFANLAHLRDLSRLRADLHEHRRNRPSLRCHRPRHTARSTGHHHQCFSDG